MKTMFELRCSNADIILTLWADKGYHHTQTYTKKVLYKLGFSHNKQSHIGNWIIFSKEHHNYTFLTETTCSLDQMNAIQVFYIYYVFCNSYFY